MSEQEDRQTVVQITRTWVGTPYHHMGAVKGVGVDCGQILKQVYVESGLLGDVQIDRYTHDWHLHRSEETYLGYLESYSGRVDDSEASINERLKADPAYNVAAGDILMWRIGRTFSHGAIVTAWPNIVHASFPSDRVEEISLIGTPMSRRPMRVYSYWSHKK